MPETTVPETTAPPPDRNALPLQEETRFLFLSGAGGWSTVLTLYPDGSFMGEFHDSEMGDFSEEYPKGSVYFCAFSGRFENITPVDDHSYSMDLGELRMENTPGEEWIEDGIRYIASDAYGIADGSRFVFYLPDTPISAVPGELLNWWPYRYDDSPRETLSCYGIYSIDTWNAFFSEG